MGDLKSYREATQNFKKLKILCVGDYLAVGVVAPRIVFWIYAKTDEEQIKTS